MARITIEDCTEKVPNRFELVQMAAIRAKQLKKGASPLVKSEDNKAVVVALREIAAGLVTPGRPLEAGDLAVDTVTESADETSVEMPAESSEDAGVSAEEAEPEA